MELAEFERVEASFRAFHAEFAPDFGRKQWREHSGDYLQGLLVQAEERRNAENMAEALPVSARALQRFLTDARWDDGAVITHLQAYLGAKLNHPAAVFAVDSSGFPKQGQQSVGVARQYCGALGKVANCQVGVFLAHVGPRGRALVDKRLYLPQAWVQDPKRCDAAGVPREQQVYRSETDLALAMLQQVQARGHLTAEWVTGDDAKGLVAGVPRRGGGGGVPLCAGSACRHPRLAAAANLGNAAVPGEGPPARTTPGGRRAPVGTGANAGAAHGGLAGDHGGRGNARAAHLPVCRRAAPGDPRRGPRPGTLGGLSREPGWERAALLLRPCRGGHAAGDLGVGRGGPLADRDGVRDRQERHGPG